MDPHPRRDDPRGVRRRGRRGRGPDRTRRRRGPGALRHELGPPAHRRLRRVHDRTHDGSRAREPGRGLPRAGSQRVRGDGDDVRAPRLDRRRPGRALGRGPGRARAVPRHPAPAEPSRASIGPAGTRRGASDLRRPRPHPGARAHGTLGRGPRALAHRPDPRPGHRVPPGHRAGALPRGRLPGEGGRVRGRGGRVGGLVPRRRCGRPRPAGGRGRLGPGLLRGLPARTPRRRHPLGRARGRVPRAPRAHPHPDRGDPSRRARRPARIQGRVRRLDRDPPARPRAPSFPGRRASPQHRLRPGEPRRGPRDHRRARASPSPPRRGASDLRGNPSGRTTRPRPMCSTTWPTSR